MDKKIETLLVTHAKIEPKKECCGFIVLDNLKQLLIIPCENIYEYPEKAFKICPYKFLEVKKKYNIVCLYHSHPVGQAIFSQKDINQAEELCIPICLYALEVNEFNIFFPKSYDVPDLIGRDYIDHFQNCWKLIYDYCVLNKLLCVQDFNFYLKRKSDYEYDSCVLRKFKNFFKKNNIKKVTDGTIKRNDVLIFSANNKTISHFGIMLENGEFLHHMNDCLSGKRMLDDVFLKKIHSVYRIANK